MVEIVAAGPGEDMDAGMDLAAEAGAVQASLPHGPGSARHGGRAALDTRRRSAVAIGGPAERGMSDLETSLPEHVRDAHRRFKAWTTEHFGHPVKRFVTVDWLKGRRSRVIDHRWSGDDHVEYRETETGGRYRLSHPYGIRWRDLVELVSYCERNGLEAHIEARSHWYPGWTVVVIFQAAVKELAHQAMERDE